MNPAVKRLTGIVASLVFLIGAIGIFSTLIIPVSGTVRELRGERDALTAAFEREQATLEAVQQIFAQYGGVSSLQETLSLALPTDESVPSIINQAQGIAKATGIIIESLNLELLPLQPVEQSTAIRPVGAVRVALELKGTYEAIKLFLDAIETNVRIMDVQELGIDDGTEGEVLRYSVVVFAYYQD